MAKIKKLNESGINEPRLLPRSSFFSAIDQHTQ
jgi:hypothetical protein